MVPVIAPSVGQAILLLAPWRYIFIFAGAFASVIWLWAWLRLRETLHPEYRMTMTVSHIAHSVRLVMGNRTSLCYTLALTVMFASIMAYVGMVQQIFADAFHRASWMPSMFALCAVTMGVAAFLNSRFVERLGMRLISHTALLCFIGVTLLHLGVAAAGWEQMWTFVAFQAVTMACFSLSVSNFGAMAMEPIGAVAGIGASLQGFVSTFAGALVFVLLAEKGRLFRQQHVAVPVGLEHGVA
jgi:DHA1 family bicyclomycin/chloramphenicol resistance-like MFS transporter